MVCDPRLVDPKRMDARVQVPLHILATSDKQRYKTNFAVECVCEIYNNVGAVHYRDRIVVAVTRDRAVTPACFTTSKLRAFPPGYL